MGKRGPRSIPTALKESLQLPSLKNVNKDEPRIPGVDHAPPAPKHLSKPAAQEWDRVVPIMVEHGMLTELDLVPLSAYCQCVGVILTTTEKLNMLAAKDPSSAALVVQSPNGAHYTNPLHTVRQGAIRDMLRLAETLGLTPASRGSISVSDHGGMSKIPKSANRGQSLAEKYNL